MPLVDDVAVEIELLAERLHDELLEVFGEQHERVLVGQDDHVLFAFAVSRADTTRGRAAWRRCRGVGLAGLDVHGGGAGEEGVDVDALQGGGDEADGGQHGGAAADPVLHREAW